MGDDGTAIQSPPKWGIYGAEAADNEAKKLVELTLIKVDDSWSGVPHESQAEWRRVYQMSQESLNLSVPCPICGVVALHRWYQIEKPINRVIEGRRFIATGGLWEWCSSCRRFEHYSCLVPEWWSCDLEIDTEKLTALPTAIEEAMKAQNRSSNSD